MGALFFRAAGACLVVLVSVLAWAAPAHAQTVVFRCASGSTITYSQTPCRQGDARELEVNDARTAEQWSDATDAAQRAAASGLQLERERRHNDAARVSASGLGSAPADHTPLPEPDRAPPRRGNELRVRGVKAPCPTHTARPAAASAPSTDCAKPRGVRLAKD